MRSFLSVRSFLSMRSPLSVRSPLLHFLLLGLVLYGVQNLWSSQSDEATALANFRIDIDEARVAILSQEFEQQMGRRAGPLDLERLIDAEVDEEVLFREALSRGLLERDPGVQTRLIQKMLFLEGDAAIQEAPELLRRARELGLQEGDIVVRRILVQKMKLLGAQLSHNEAPTASEIAERYEAARKDYTDPDRATLSHVFVSADAHGTSARTEASRLRDQILRGGLSPQRAIPMGDSFPLGHHLARRSARDLDRSFGAAFSEAVFAAPTAEWSEPVSSAYGEHLLWIEALEVGKPRPLEEVQDQIRHALAREKGDAKLKASLRRWRSRYAVSAPEAARPGPQADSRSKTTLQPEKDS